MTITKFLKNLSVGTAGALTIALGIAGAAQAATVIDTTPYWNGLDKIFLFGESDNATYGQTFTVGSDNVLNDFTFWLDDNNDQPDVIKFAGYVAEWDGFKATGPILYESEKRSTTKAPGFEQFTFNTGGLNLESGKKYVAFLSASKFFDEVPDWGSTGIIFDNSPYSGGEFVFIDNGSNFNFLTVNSWNNVDFDIAFRASFSQSASVPEPTSAISLLAFGTLGAGSMLKRKKSTVKA